MIPSPIETTPQTAHSRREFAAKAAPSALVYVQDRDTEGVIRQSLADLSLTDAVIANANIKTAIGELASQPSPQLLIVDVSKTSEPLERLKELANECEPSTGVIVIGESNDISFYRHLKELGVFEYFYKPVIRDLFTQACSAILTGERGRSDVGGGKLVLTVSARGGVGASTITTRTAWHLAKECERRALLIDLDVYLGDIALQLGAVPTNGLREALEHPERVDDLFLERAVIHAAPKLDLLASLAPLGDSVRFEEDAVLSLLQKVMHHYRYVFVDVPGAVAAHMTEFMHLPSICLLVSDARLVSARDVARWRELIGPGTPDRTTYHVLNKLHAPGGLSVEQFTKAAGQRPDIIIPFAREVENAATLGAGDVAKLSALAQALAPVFREIAGKPVADKRNFMERIFG